MAGILYLVPTPIGNLKDITFRAIEVLKETDYIVCEDTRQTVKLINHYGIKKSLVSFYSHNQFRRIPELLSDLKEGKRLALVSDGGTPGISDPGFLLVRKALDEHINVIPLPGPTAFVTALVGSGLSTNGFVFLGFLKRKAGKLKKELNDAAQIGKTIVFYESPYRIKKTLTLCKEVFAENAETVLARELTKSFEEFIRGTLLQVISQIENRELKGEFVVMISPVDRNDNEVMELEND